MKGLLLLLLFFVSGSVRANNLDSLYLRVRQDVKGHLTEVNTLITQLDAQGWADTLITFRPQDRTERIEATLALYMAYSCYDRGMYSMSEELAAQVVRLCDQLEDYEMKSDALSHLSTTCLRLGKLDEAIEQGIEGLHIDSMLHDQARLSSSYNNLAAFCLAGGHPQEGKQYILKAISIEEPLHNPDKLAIRYGIASEIFSHLKEYDRALEYITMAYELDKKQGNPIGAARRQSQMADVYLAQQDYDAAERLYNAALEVLRQADEQNSQVITLKQLGRLYKETGRWEKCMQVLQQVDQKVRLMGNKYQLMQNLKLLSEAYMHKGLWREAADCSNEALALNEEVLNSKMDQLATEYSMRFQMKELEYQHRQQERATGRSSFHNYCILIIILLGMALVVPPVYVRLRQKTCGRAKTPAASNADRDTESEPSEVTGIQTHENPIAAESQPENPAAREDETVSEPVLQVEPDAAKKGRRKSISDLVGMDIEVITRNLSSEDDDHLFRFRRIVMENLSTVDVEMIRTRLGLSKEALSDLTNRTVGVNPKTLIQYYKMVHATHLLTTTNRTINDISAECGYYDNSYFGRVFSDTYGMTPGEYRNSMKESR